MADIVDTAKAAGSFSTLVAAAQAAGLVDMLKGAAPFVVFTPTDAAFAKIPKATVDALLKGKAALTKQLPCHVVPGKVITVDVKPGLLKTVEGESATVTAAEGKDTIDRAHVIKTGIVTDNGVIQVINTVRMPKV